MNVRSKGGKKNLQGATGQPYYTRSYNYLCTPKWDNIRTRWRRKRRDEPQVSCVHYTSEVFVVDWPSYYRFFLTSWVLVTLVERACTNYERRYVAKSLDLERPPRLLIFLRMHSTTGSATNLRNVAVSVRSSTDDLRCAKTAKLPATIPIATYRQVQNAHDSWLVTSWQEERRTCATSLLSSSFFVFFFYLRPFLFFLFLKAPRLLFMREIKE